MIDVLNSSVWTWSLFIVIGFNLQYLYQSSGLLLLPQKGMINIITTAFQSPWCKPITKKNPSFVDVHVEWVELYTVFNNLFSSFEYRILNLKILRSLLQCNIFEISERATRTRTRSQMSDLRNADAASRDDRTKVLAAVQRFGVSQLEF